MTFLLSLYCQGSSVKHARDTRKQYARRGAHFKRLQRSKHTTKMKQTNPLRNSTMVVCNKHGRPKKNKEQRRKPLLPVRVSVETRIKQLREAATKWLGKQ